MWVVKIFSERYGYKHFDGYLCGVESRETTTLLEKAYHFSDKAEAEHNASQVSDYYRIEEVECRK